MSEKLSQVYECPTCGYRLGAPLPYSAAWCPTKHRAGDRRKRGAPMDLIWDTSAGGTPPSLKKVKK